MYHAPETPTEIPQDQEARFAKMENDIGEIKQALFQTLHAPKTWAQVARNPPATTPATTSTQGAPHPASPLPRKQQIQAEIRRERAQYQLTLTAVNATGEIKTCLATATYEEITERCQKAIRTSIGNAVPPLPEAE